VYEDLGGEDGLGGGVVDAPDPADYAVVVNTTSVGLYGEDPFEELPLRADGFAEGQVVVDMVYGERPSAILAAAERCGARTVDGLEVLVQQGARSFQIWTGHEPDLNTMRAAARTPTSE
jgi:shikimate dehydrogenase